MMLIGYFATVLMTAGAISNRLSWALAAPIGMGICSIIFYFFRRPMFTVEFALLVVLFALWLHHGRQNGRRVTTAKNGLPKLAGWMIAALTWVTFASFIWVGRGPHGEWDAWAIWNAHARYLYRSGPVWPQHIIDTAHPDYPLLLPAANARLWRYIGSDVPEAVGIQLVLITITGVIILAATLWEVRADSVSFLIPTLLIGTPFYLMLGIWQYADVPLSIYILVTLALLCIHWEREPHRSRLLVLAGFTAGCAAWTKNEGLLFVVAVSTVLGLPFFWFPVKTIRRLALFYAGLLLPLAVTLHFTLTVPPPNPIIHQTPAELFQKISDASRYTLIATTFLRVAGSFGRWAIHPGIPLIALLGLWGIDRRVVRNGGWITGTTAFVLMLLGYFAVYLISPYSLDFHLPSSLDRLLIHLWLPLLFLAGSVIKRRTPETAIEGSQP
jgi:hypothetical protein